MKSPGFEEINHTADLAIRVWGEDFHSLLLQAAMGLYHLLDVKTKEDSRVNNSFSVEVESREAMLVDFLNELLYLCEDQEQQFNSFTFTEEDNRLLVKAAGEEVKSIQRYIKAVTFHDLEIKKDETGLETTITFDV